LSRFRRFMAVYHGSIPARIPLAQYSKAFFRGDYLAV
jgi:hypothetical protein